MTGNQLRSVLGRRSVVTGAILAVVLFLLPSASAHSAQGGGKGKSQGTDYGKVVKEKITKDVLDKARDARSGEMISVIVQTTGDPSAEHLGRMRGRGASIKKHHKAIRGYSARVPASEIQALADDPEVEHVSIDAPVSAHMDTVLAAIKSDQAFLDLGGFDGRGIGIAIVDTGVQSHPDLQRPAGVPQVIEVETVRHETSRMDYFGHGTHVAGIINGNGSASSGALSFRTFKGIAPGAQIISIRALNSDGSGFTSDVIAGIDWAVTNKSAYNIRVLNLSLGHPVFESYQTDPLCLAVKHAVDQGIVVVVAAGNDGAVGSGFGTVTSPGNEPRVITVGSMDDGNTVTTTDDVLAWFSSRGPSLVDYVVKPDLVAPGMRIVSLRAPESYLDLNYHAPTLKIGDYKTDPVNALTDGSYYELSGTSMSAPMVAATAALMLQKTPGLNPATVKARLMASAGKDAWTVFETGAGYLDVLAALSATGTATNADSPKALLASDGAIYFQDTAAWGSDWTLPLVFGAAKGSAAGVSLTAVPSAILNTYGPVWKGKAGLLPVLENSMVTASGQIWSAQESSSTRTTGTVDILTAIWGGGR
jgi:serine protease AprX